MRTTLTSGAWVEHRPIQDLKGADKRALARIGKPEVVLTPSGEPDLGSMLGGMDIMTWVADQQDAVWALAITAWSWEHPVPAFDGAGVTGVEVFGELPLDDYEELETLFAPFLAKLTRKPDPKGTTTSSSNGSSRASGAHGSRTA